MCEWWKVSKLADAEALTFEPGGYVNSAVVRALVVTKLYDTVNTRDVFYVATGIGDLYFGDQYLTSTAAHEAAQRWCGGRDA